MLQTVSFQLLVCNLDVCILYCIEFFSVDGCYYPVFYVALTLRYEVL